MVWRLRVGDPIVQARLAGDVRHSLRGDVLDVAHFSQSVAVPRPSGRPHYMLQFSAPLESNELAGGIATPRALHPWVPRARRDDPLVRKTGWPDRQP